jgi:CubicO group peptidase (beta-lactamase class C family)
MNMKMEELEMKITVFSKPTVRIMASLLLVCLVVNGFVAIPALASSNPLIQASSDSQENVITATDLETFTDELIEKQLDEYHIAGAAVTIVQDGKIELAKGYGYANVAKQIPVSPDETIFRIGSTSKLFTWTAVMQLAEQGKIDLNSDINIYLPDFQIPTTYPKPITMLNLMSHTAGFEERTIGIESHTPEEMISLHDYLARYMPDRVRPAGELTAYSNYGTALAGYIVEVVSGMPFEQYIEAFIFAPLSMSHSTFRQPLPPNLADHLANSYSYTGEFVPGVFTYPNLIPAATMSSTAHDMANFLIAHLQEGRFESSQMLKPETVRQMHSHLFSNDERLDGFAYGFMEWDFNGQRILWHSGDIGNWHSGVAIIPEENLGFFVNYNSNEGFSAVAEFYYSFMDAFFPAPENSVPPIESGLVHEAKDLAGEYRSTRSVYNHVERIVYFPGNDNLNISLNKDSTLSIDGLIFYEKEPRVYSLKDGTSTLVFHQDGNGKITHMQFNDFPQFAYERVSWYEASTFNWVAFGACTFLLLTAFLAAFIGIFRRSKGVKVESHIPRIARLWAFIISVVFLLVPVAIAVYTKYDYKSPFPLYMMIVLAIILAASILVIGPVIFTILAWVRRFWGKAGRIHYTLVTLALLGIVWLMYYWRLLGFRY